MPGKIVCYYSAWANYRNVPMDYDIEHIDGKLCTHLIYAFAGINEKTYELEGLDPEYDYVRGKCLLCCLYLCLTKVKV